MSKECACKEVVHVSYPSKAPPGIIRTCFVLPTHARKRHLGLSPPANPALIIPIAQSQAVLYYVMHSPLPLSITIGWFAKASDIFFNIYKYDNQKSLKRMYTLYGKAMMVKKDEKSEKMRGIQTWIYRTPPLGTHLVCFSFGSSFYTLAEIQFLVVDLLLSRGHCLNIVKDYCGCVVYLKNGRKQGERINRNRRNFS